ncbi:MAG: DUF6502 family protein [Steroidobacteraceae bacterium]
MGIGKRIGPSKTKARTKALEQAAENSARGQLILQELLTELAAILVPRGVTPTRFSEMAKHAFAHAAAAMSRFRNGRVNQSKVAVLTGLRRAEVRKLLTCSHPTIRANDSDQSLIDTVISGWCADKHFMDKRGAPKRLLVTGGKASFARLVQRYGGDVPHRAVLDELRRIGVAQQVGRHVEVRSLSILRQRRSFASLAYLLPAIVDGIRLASRPKGRAGYSYMHRLTLSVPNVFELEMVRDRCVSSIKSLLGGLGQSLGAQESSPCRAKKTRHSCTVTVLLIENKAPHDRGRNDFPI